MTVGIMAPEGMAAPARKPRPDETVMKALVRTHWRRRIEVCFRQSAQQSSAGIAARVLSDPGVKLFPKQMPAASNQGELYSFLLARPQHSLSVARICAGRIRQDVAKPERVIAVGQ
jgi:hypothetical protein